LAEQITTPKKEEKLASTEQITTTRGNKNLIGGTKHDTKEGRKM
jgi:hypothetical protein